MVFGFGFRLCCERLCKYGVCFCMPFWVDDLFLDLMICYVLVVDVKFVCVLVLPFFL